MSAVCLSYTVYRSITSKHSCENFVENFIWIIIEINVNPKGLDYYYLIIYPSNILRCLNLLLDYNNLSLDYNNLLPYYNYPIIIHYYYNPWININLNCPAGSELKISFVDAY